MRICRLEDCTEKAFLIAFDLCSVKPVAKGQNRLKAVTCHSPWETNLTSSFGRYITATGLRGVQFGLYSYE